MFMLYPINFVLYELHSAVLPQARGEGSQSAAKAMLQWLWANTPALSLMTWVPAYNRPAAVAAKRAGFVERARLPGAYMKDGKSQDLFLYGVEKCPP
jgi:RimJ/RimL family protein N-acetyltransferase